MPENQDLAPMELLAHSFESAATPLRQTFDRESPLRPDSVDMNMMDLKQDGCDFSIGDISPIKFVYSNASQHESQSEETIPHQPPLSQAHHQQNNPFYVIRSFAKVFSKFKYALPCLQGIGLPSVNLSAFSPVRQIHAPNASTVDLDIKVALRRVEAAVCAFGGTVQDYRRHAQSIFRLRDRVAEDTRMEYERVLAGRYYLSGSRLSWDFEENPPVAIEDDDEGQARRRTTCQLTDSPAARDASMEHQSSPSSQSSYQSCDSKLKYRCKLCGQIKNNHTCPYRLPLQRSIGIMVYPAVNSFTAFEPGTVAPPLTKMNNFVSYDSDYSGPPRFEESQQNQKQHHQQIQQQEQHQPQRLMESFMSAESHLQPQNSLFHSPQSSLSSHEENPQHQHQDQHQNQDQYLHANDAQPASEALQSSRKRPREEEQERKSLFVASVTLRPEHYRAVTPSDTPSAYCYPAVPLTFAERKRLSDTLFHLSKEIPHLTAECAAVLRLARDHGDWDLAVAELLAQVLVGMFCDGSDSRLDGLSEYLLTLGISC